MSSASLAVRSSGKTTFLFHPTVISGTGPPRRRAVPPPLPAPPCVLTVSKTNVGRTPRALGYRVIELPDKLPRLEWLGPVDRTADRLCAGKPPAVLKMRDRAVDWLKRELIVGPRTAADVYAAARAGIAERTLEWAKQELPARSHRTWDKDEERGEWYWYDPDAAWPAGAPFEKPYEFPPLPPLPGM